MVYNVEKIMRDAKICMDQNMQSGALLSEGDIDTLTLDDIIRSKIPEAVDSIHKTAPAWLLEEGHRLTGPIHWEDSESGWIVLPHDFMRLVCFEMSDWERPVYAAIAPGTAEYALQRQRIKALRGTAQKPVVAICNRPFGKVLEFYSCKSEEAYVRQGGYMPYSQVDKDGGIDISERCYRAVVYAVAALALLSIGEGEQSQAMTQLSQSSMA